MTTLSEPTILQSIQERARRALTACKRRRKHLPPGPFTSVEIEALEALTDIVRVCRRDQEQRF